MVRGATTPLGRSLHHDHHLLGNQGRTRANHDQQSQGQQAHANAFGGDFGPD
jgi:hypothetical protein